MAFSSGFSAGLQLGNNIKRNKLDREMLDWRKQSAADDLAMRKQLADQRAQEIAADLKLRQEDLADRKADTAADNARLDADSSWRRQSAIMGGLGSALAGARQNRDYAEQIKALKAGGGAAAKPQAFRTVRREDPDTGEVTTERYPIAVPEQGGAAQASAPATEMDPAAAAVAAEIKRLQTQIGQHKVKIALGDHDDGYMPWAPERTDQIAKAEQQISSLRAMQGGAQAPEPTAQAAAAPRQLPPAIQQQFDQQLAEAVKWAQANPNDPRAAAIMQRVQAMQPR